MKSLHTKENWGLFLLRFGVGVVFVVHGFSKVVSFSDTIAFMGNVGFPMPAVFAVIVTAIELLGGLALLIGLYTKVAAALIAVVMLVAIIMVKGQQGFLGAAELDFALLFSALAIMLIGPGGLRLRFGGGKAKAGKSESRPQDEVIGGEGQV